ncbi:acyloxyacyl hydrolase [Rhizobium sp. S152]|uniref:acyloxyacyl hydrolase n=1 Tax=Rhizobium sp. S152 TaxID=3055038 RepID=UPI0025A9F443|nr:acyloxyacyl hydrolase [Rhizobium sp. S152]MDM9628233.1 acyloxyacyl hydrolase [Rhizobium sp. S152]
MASKRLGYAWSLTALTLTLAASGSISAQADDQIFDELRFGASASIQDGNSRESGLFPEVTVFFDPFDQRGATDWKTQLARPRVNLGTSIGTSGEATQVFGGFAWTVNFNEKIFAEAGFGGVWHNGELDDNDNGPDLGCHLLFHEYLGAGYRFDNHWNVIAQVAHSSHANLCDGPNDGMTRAGLQVGYKF